MLVYYPLLCTLNLGETWIKKIDRDTYHFVAEAFQSCGDTTIYIWVVERKINLFINSLPAREHLIINIEPEQPYVRLFLIQMKANIDERSCCLELTWGDKIWGKRTWKNNEYSFSEVPVKIYAWKFLAWDKFWLSVYDVSMQPCTHLHLANSKRLSVRAAIVVL